MTRVGARGPAFPAARDAGFTMIEVMVTMVVAGVLMATSAWTFFNYQRAHEQSSTAIRLTSTLRNAAERALSEGRTYCVFIDPATSSFDTYRQDCTDPSRRVNRANTDSSRVGLASVAFPAGTSIPNQRTDCSTAGACAYFYPRGNALAGTAVVTRQGSAKTYTIRVEGLTSRVSRS